MSALWGSSELIAAPPCAGRAASMACVWDAIKRRSAECGSVQAGPAGNLVELLQDRAVRRSIVGAPPRQVALVDHPGERRPRAAYPALDRADGAAADLRCLLVREATRAAQQQRLAPFRGESQQGAVEIGQEDRLFLVSRRGQDALGGALVVLAAKPAAAHVGELGVAQDHERPRT